MKRVAGGFVLSLLSLMAAGCGSGNAEAAMDNYLKNINDTSDVLEGVKDKASRRSRQAEVGQACLRTRREQEEVGSRPGNEG